MFEATEALWVPIYLHPIPPPRAVYDAYCSGFGEDIGFMFEASISDETRTKIAHANAERLLRL